MTSAHLRIPVRRGALPAVRRWVTGRAVEQGLAPDVVRTVELLTSELAANAVRHGAGPDLLVRVDGGDGTFRVAVTDRGERMPVVRTTGPEVPGGQGMRLVAMLASDWGVDPSPGGGKTVWFSVRDDDGA